MALIDHWHLFRLRITTPRLELRIPDDDDLSALLEVARNGIHDPGSWLGLAHQGQGLGKEMRLGYVVVSLPSWCGS